MIPLELAEIEAIFGGRVESAPWAEQITGVEIDSRRVSEGDLFVAIGGGVDFVKHAFARGAAAVAVPEDAFAAMGARTRLRVPRGRLPITSFELTSNTQTSPQRDIRRARERRRGA